MQIVFINECKSCKTSSQMFFNLMFSFSKTKVKLVMTYIRYWKIKLFTGPISHGASNEPEIYFEPSQTFTRDVPGKYWTWL